MYNGKLMLICACEATLKEQMDEERWGASQQWQYMYICIEYSIFPLHEPYTEKQNHPFLHEFLNICQEVIYPASQGLLFELLVQLMH